MVKARENPLTDRKCSEGSGCKWIGAKVGQLEGGNGRNHHHEHSLRVVVGWFCSETGGLGVCPHSDNISFSLLFSLKICSSFFCFLVDFVLFFSFLQSEEGGKEREEGNEEEDENGRRTRAGRSPTAGTSRRAARIYKQGEPDFVTQKEPMAFLFFLI